MKIAIVTGSAGLIGSQACKFFHEKGFKIVGIDNDMRSYFFGKEASTSESKISLENNLENYEHHNIDIRNYDELEKVFDKYSSDIDIVIHAAAQPSHDWAVKEPITDFTINALGTINMLELTRLKCPKSVFIFTSTNKVYGDKPNYLKLVEEETRWEIDYNYYTINVTKTGNRDWYYDGIGIDGSINENLGIDNCKHSIFGVSKVSADVMCQEYGKYFGMNIGIFRGGCLTGPNHAGAELHGFLSYLVKCIVHNRPYTIFGYKAKQVRDNIHSLDLIKMFWEFYKNPKQGEVYNCGGGRKNSVSILEAIDMINKIADTNWNNYSISDENRIGDHIWYISDISKFKKEYPDWDIQISIEETIKQMVDFEKSKIII